MSERLSPEASAVEGHLQASLEYVRRRALYHSPRTRQRKCMQVASVHTCPLAVGRAAHETTRLQPRRFSATHRTASLGSRPRIRIATLSRRVSLRTRA